jgi:hypothetical protein
MAGRIRNRRELREQAEHAEALQVVPAESVATVALPKKASKRKAAAAPNVKKPRKTKARPRLRACWGVFDGSMKQVAIFDYNQRAAADEKLAGLLATKKGTHFLQLVKEPIPQPTAEVAVVE